MYKRRNIAKTLLEVGLAASSPLKNVVPAHQRISFICPKMYEDLNYIPKLYKLNYINLMVSEIFCKIKFERKSEERMTDMSNDKLFKKIVAENRKGYLARINL